MNRPSRSQGFGDNGQERLEESNGREDRAGEDEARTNDGTMTNERQRRQMLRDEFKQEALPPVPHIYGMHLCWLSTTNQQDPISRRARLGYVPVRYGEVPGMDMGYKMQSGEFGDCVQCNEMILFKLPEEMYQTMMDEFHHQQPLEQEKSIIDNLNQQQEVDSNGRTLVENEEGMNQLVQRARRPIFS